MLLLPKDGGGAADITGLGEDHHQSGGLFGDLPSVVRFGVFLALSSP